jgi:hypothetical protein
MEFWTLDFATMMSSIRRPTHQPSAISHQPSAPIRQSRFCLTLPKVSIHHDRCTKRISFPCGSSDFGPVTSWGIQVSVMANSEVTPLFDILVVVTWNLGACWW